MPEQFPRALLAQLVAAQLAVDPERLTFEPIPTGKHNTSYYVGGAGKALVLRISPADDAGFLFYERRMMVQEPGLHRLLRDETTVPVAKILAFDDSRSLVDRDYLLMERLPGRPLTETQLSGRKLERVQEQVGNYLAQMHSLVADRFGYLGPHRPMSPQPEELSAGHE